LVTDWTDQVGDTSGLGGANEVLRIAAAGDDRLPNVIHNTYAMIADAVRSIELRLADLDREIAANVKVDDACRRLSTIPGIGPVTSSMIVALAGDVSRFSSGRDFAAWLGLTPRQNSSGGKARLGRITKADDQTLRTLLVLGAFTIIRRARVEPAKASPWLLAMRTPRYRAAAFLLAWPPKRDGRLSLLGPPRRAATRLRRVLHVVAALRVQPAFAACLSGRFSPPTPLRGSGAGR
jgi:transposase